MDLSIDLRGLEPGPGTAAVETIKPGALDAMSMLTDRKGKGSEFLGWLDLPDTTQSELLNVMQQTAVRLASLSEVCVVVGIGGSYLGARAVIEALKHSFSSMIEDRPFPEIVYAGHHLSGDYLSDLLELLDQKEYSVIVISKSGTTTEPAVAFRLLKAHLEKKYGKPAARDRIVAITDRSKGALKKLADQEKYSSFIVPDDVGGRFSVLSPVGLLPIAVAGFDIGTLLKGAARMKNHLMACKDTSNPAIVYAAARHACYQAGLVNEVMVNYDPRLYYLSEWWKQLYGESEGKDGKGIFPAGVSFTTDLHSMGQYLQDGERCLFETVISINGPGRGLRVPEDPEDADGLNFLAGKPFAEVNRMAEQGTFLAHRDGGVPVIRISVPALDEWNLGQLLYFFEFACGISAYMLGVNPFDQPGVEAYKKNMFALLNKPGFEEEGKKLREKL